MAYRDRVGESFTTTGTGTITLTGARTGFSTFVRRFTDGTVVPCVLLDPVTGDWEVTSCTVGGTGTTLARTTVLSSSNADALVSFAAGTKTVTHVLPSADANTFVIANPALTSGRIPYVTTGGALADDSGLTYDAANDRLMIGGGASSAANDLYVEKTVAGNIRISIKNLSNGGTAQGGFAATNDAGTSATSLGVTSSGWTTTGTVVAGDTKLLSLGGKFHIYTADAQPLLLYTGGASTTTEAFRILGAPGSGSVAGNIGIGAAGGVPNPTAYLHIKAGTATAGTAPLKFNSGTLLTTAEAGAVEFLTDKWYGTITTGAARKELALCDAALTAGKVPLITTNGRLMDGVYLPYEQDSVHNGWTWNTVTISKSNRTGSSVNHRVSLNISAAGGTAPWNVTQLTIGSGAQESPEFRLVHIDANAGTTAANEFAGAVSVSQSVVYGSMTNGLLLYGLNKLLFATGLNTAPKVAVMDNAGLWGFGHTVPARRVHVSANVVTEGIRCETTAAGTVGYVEMFSAGTGGILPGTVGLNASAGPLLFAIAGVEYSRLTSVTLTCPSITAANLTSGRIPFSTTNGKLIDAAGFTYGGGTVTVQTLQIPTLPVGRVTFTDGSSNITNSGNLRFDSGNGWLGVGNAVPLYMLHVQNNSASGAPAQVVADYTNVANATGYSQFLLRSNTGDVGFLSAAGTGFTQAGIYQANHLNVQASLQNLNLIASASGKAITFTVGGTATANTVAQAMVAGFAINGPATTFTPTAYLHLAAGAATAGRAPFKFTSGPLLTTAEAGAHEFLTDKYYVTITTGAARKELALLEAALATNIVPVVNASGRLAATSLSFDNAGNGLTAVTSVSGFSGGGFQNVSTGTAAGGAMVVSNSTAAFNIWKLSTGYTASGLLTPDTGVLFNASSAMLLVSVGDIIFATASFGGEAMRIASAASSGVQIGNIGIGAGGGVTSPTAYLHIRAGTATAGTAPLKFNSGTLLTTPEVGAMEYDGTNLWFTHGVATNRDSVWCSKAGASGPTPISASGLSVIEYFGIAVASTIQVLALPTSWAAVVINGTTYKVPLYT